MKVGRFKKSVSVILLLCMIISMLPPVQITHAAEITQRYELDTDGIDVGAQYLIVSGTGSSAQALRMDSSTIWQSSSTAVTVHNGNTIESFPAENACVWTFSSATNGTVSNSGLYLNIEQYTRYQSAAATLQFANLGGGAYGIYLHGGRFTNLQYLVYGQNNMQMQWYTAYKYGVTGTDPNAYESGRGYLFFRDLYG